MKRSEEAVSTHNRYRRRNPMTRGDDRSTALTTTFLLLLIAAAGPAAAQQQMSIGQLSDEQRQDLLDVKGLAPPGIPHTLDLSDAKQDRFLERLMSAAGLVRGPADTGLETFLDQMDDATPQAQAPTLLQTAGQHGTWHPVGMISQLSKMEDNRYYAAGIVALPDAEHQTLLLQLFERPSWRPIGDLAVVQDWFADHLTISAEGRSKSSDVGAVFAYLYHTDGQPLPTAQVIFKTLGSVPDPTVTVTNPVRRADCPAGSTKSQCCTLGSGDDKRDCIKICLNRTSSCGDPGTGGDCDYNRISGEGNCERPRVQISGYADSFARNINTSGDPKAYLLGLAASGGFLATIINPGDDNGNSGACTFSPQDFCFSATDSRLDWNTGKIDQQIDPAGGYAIDPPDKLGTACALSSDAALATCLDTTVSHEAYLLVTLKVALVSDDDPHASDTVTITVASETIADDDIEGTVKEIPDLFFGWGCLAAGTPVRMADGSERPVEEVLVQEKVVADNDGRTLTVIDTFLGTEDLPLVIVEDVQGKVVAMTETHPVITERGVLLAKQLTDQDVLITVDGPARVKEVRRGETGQKVYNLRLGGEGEEVDDENATFFAGGILVGDDRMQGAWERKYEASEGAADELPEQWREDYKKWLRQKGKRK